MECTMNGRYLMTDLVLAYDRDANEDQQYYSRFVVAHASRAPDEVQEDIAENRLWDAASGDGLDTRSQ